MRLAFPRMFLFRFWCQPRPRICWPFRRVLGDLPPNSDLEQKGINEHSAFCCFFFPRKRIPGDFHLPKWTFLNPSGSGVVQAYWHQSEWRNHGAEADHCHDEISGIGAAGFFSIKKHLWSLAYSRSTITRYLSEVNFFFFWATQHHLIWMFNQISYRIQDVHLPSSIHEWHEDLFFCSSTINLLWDDQWWIAVAGDKPPQSKPWNRKAIEISNIKLNILSRILRPPVLVAPTVLFRSSLVGHRGFNVHCFNLLFCEIT